MTPEEASEPAKTPKTPPSTAGMTTKVVKGSLWTLAGQVAPLLATFVATPFVIRLLGSEKYGVLILIGLIPTYMVFADFGMSLASTRFGSEAHGQGDGKKEAEIIRMAVLIAIFSSIAFILPVVIYSAEIVSLFSVPHELHQVASTGLKISATAFAIGLLAQVVNTPMLARLRMDLNTACTAVPKILMIVATPLVLYFGGGILGAVLVAFVTGLVALGAIFYNSGRLSPDLYGWTIKKEHFRPLIKYGGAFLIGGVAGICLANLEKLFLTSFVAVKSLAYYSVAFTFANMATMFSQSMIQSLVPAFSQLSQPGQQGEFNALFARSVRLNLIVTFPAIMIMFVIGRPFFTIWAGPEFGEESTVPFYILLVGLMFNIMAFIPFTTILARGRSDIIAKLYWVELTLYAVVAYFLIVWFGIWGAAASWTLRVVLDAIAMIWLSKRIAGVSYRFLAENRGILGGVLLLVPPVLLVMLHDASYFWLLGASVLSITLYFTVAWKHHITVDERAWVVNRFRQTLG